MGGVKLRTRATPKTVYVPVTRRGRGTDRNDRNNRHLPGCFAHCEIPFWLIERVVDIQSYNQPRASKTSPPGVPRVRDLAPPL